MLKQFVFSIIVLLFVVGCQPAETSPTPTATDQPTATASSTPEPMATATVTSTATPDVPSMDMTGMDYQIMITDGPEGALYRLGIGWHVDEDMKPPIYVSPDSRLLALPATTGLYIFTADSFEPVWAATDQSFVVRAIWSPDGSLVAGLSRSGTVSIFTASDGTRQKQFQVEFEYWAKMGISPDNRLIFVGEHLFDLDTGEELACVDCAHTGDDDYDVQMAFTSDSALRAAHPCDEAVFCLWDSDTGETALYPLPGVQEGGPLSISPDGNWVIVRTDNTVQLFDVQAETYHQLPELTNIPFGESGFYWVGNVSWSPGSTAFTINAGERVYLFQPGSETSTLIWEGKEYHYFIWSPDSSLLLHGTQDITQLYSAGDWDTIREVEEVTDVRALLNDGTMFRATFIYGEYYNGLLAFTGDEPGPTRALITDFNVKNLVSAGWTPDNLLMTIADDDQMLFFDGPTGEGVSIQYTGDDAFWRTWPYHRDFQWSADGSRLTWNVYQEYGEENQLPLWDRAAGRLINVFNVPGRETCCVALSSDGSRLLAGSDRQSTIILFDVETGEILHQVNEDDYSGSGVVDLVWSPDGSQFASVDGGTIESIIVWDAETFTPLYTLMPEWEDRTYIRTLNWAGDLIAGYGYDDVFVWQPDTQSLLWSASLEPKGDACEWLAASKFNNQMALSLDGRYLAVVTGGASQGCGRIAIFDAHTGELLHTYPGNGTTSITRLVWSPDGQYLASVADQDTIVVWDTSLLPPVEIP